jgi:uncharacterized protein DUF3558
MLVLLAGMALAGCTEKDPGQPVANDQKTPSGAAQKSVAVPPPPREIKLDGLDPCKLLTKPQLDQIKVNRQRNSVQTEEAFKGSQICAMDGGDGQIFWDYEIWLVTTEGIQPWLSGKRNVDAKLVDVGGFPAADYKVLGTTTFDCSTSVGVATGQQLTVVFRPSRQAFTQNEMCQKSEQAAGLAMQTLQTLK